METLPLLVILFSLLALLATPALSKKRPADPKSTIDYAKCYDAAAPDWNAFLEFLTPRVSGDVLELSCGTGGRIGALPHTVRAVGLDTSAELLQLAEHRYAPQVTFQLGDPQNPALFPKEQFDAVFCCGDALFYATNKELVFYSVKQWLEPGGLFVANVAFQEDPPPPAATNVQRTTQWLGNKRRERVVCNGKTYTTTHTLYPESEAMLLRVAKRAGFELVGEVTPVAQERYAVFVAGL